MRRPLAAAIVTAACAAPVARAPSVAFDPGAARVGDAVAGLRVAERNVERAADGAWVGSVRFTGLLVLRGRTLAHPDYPDVAAPCFEADSASAARMPRWRGDTRRAWLCFADPADALRRLGAPASPRAAVVAIDDYTIHWAHSDVVNTARLERVEQLGATRAADRQRPAPTPP